MNNEDETRALINEAREQAAMFSAGRGNLIHRLADALEAALSEDDTEWEYSIAYRDEGDWEGADDLFADEQSARISLRDGGYRWNDQVVRRRKAGPWEPVEVSS